MEERIWAAKSRYVPLDVFEKEMIQARILAVRGSAVFFLPELRIEGHTNADAVVDGLLWNSRLLPAV